MKTYIPLLLILFLIFSPSSSFAQVFGDTTVKNTHSNREAAEFLVDGFRLDITNPTPGWYTIQLADGKSLTTKTLIRVCQ